MENSLLSVKEAAERCGVSPDTIRRVIGTGALRAFRIGGRSIRIFPSDLESYLQDSRMEISPAQRIGHFVYHKGDKLV